jgi:hypothetical protein
MEENPRDKAEAIADAVIESERMECTARYLDSGRRFANIETKEIKRRCTKATRIFLKSYGGANPREMDDLTSELALRNVPLSFKDLSRETAAVARWIKYDDDPEVHARVESRIRSFLDDLEKRQN